ncbi:MAG: type IV pilus secretin PilQ [Myxococcota bacterium]
MTRSSKKHPRARRWTPLCLLCAPASLLLTLQPQQAAASGLHASAVLPQLLADSNRVDGLAVEELDDGTTILRLQGTNKPTFNVYRLSDPDRLVVDIAKSAKGSVVPHVPLDTWACGRVTVKGVSEREAKLVRVVVELKREASYIVVPDGDALVVTVTPREVPPEAYFSRKSAQTRRTELESTKRRAAQAEADASRLKAKASQEAKAAEARAVAAEKKLAAAEATANRARSAEARARAAEQAAQAELGDAKSNRLKVRRALKKATAEREKAESDRQAAEAKLATAEKSAQAKRRESERVLAAAEAVARKRLADAAAKNRNAERTLADAAAKNRNADRTLADAAAKNRNADRALADAQGSRNAAKAELDAARKSAAAVEVKSKQRLAAAERKAKQAEAEASRARKAAASADSEAKKTLAAAEAKAKTRLGAAQKELEQAQKNAKKAEAAAKDRLAQAKRRAAATEAEAEKKAAAILASARSEAAAAQRNAKQQAASMLADAKRDAASLKKKRLAEAEAAAAAKVARAEKDARVAAKQRLAKAEAEAERKLAAAKKRARKDAIASAEQELAQLRASKASAVAAAAKTARTSAQSKASKDLAAQRKRIEADAANRIAQAEARASKAEAGALAANETVAKAEADRKRAQTEQAQAEKKLASAESARKRAEAEKSKAERARKAAERQLAELRASAETARRGKARRQAEAKLAAAEKDRDAAVERQLAASKKLSSLASDAKKARDARDEALDAQAKAESQLLALQQEAQRLRTQLEARDAQLAKLETQAKSASKRGAASKGKANAKARGKAKLQDVRFEQDERESRVIVEFDGPARYDGMTLTPTIQLLKFSGAKMGKKLERSLDATKHGGAVRVVTSFSEGKDAKVIVSTNGPVKPRLEERPGALVWHFPNPPKAYDAPATKVAAQQPVRRPQPKAVSVDGTKVGGFASAPTPRSMMAPAPAQADVTGGRRSSRARWRGERIDIELQDAPIKDVLLLFSDIGRVNIVAGDGVDGSVTMKLNSVPWDQALDIILRSLKLGSVREGNVIRVATLETLEQEQRDAIERANARVQLKPLETRLVPLSYATVDEMIPKVQAVLSPRGTVTPDTRTNTLIIMDVAANIALAQDLVKSLDTQTPQVLIEARIVEARTTFTRQLGIQWGFDFTASPGTGNPTGLLFPNSIGLGGGGTGTPVDSRGLVLPGAAANPNYAVDLPAPVGTGAGGAVGMSFGSISGNLNTNLRLSAAESQGEVRIISAPKVVTLDNSEATIEQGVQIPISQVSAQGVNTRFVNATLSLQVTPHVTNEGAVLLDVNVQKNEADFVNTGARGDPTILTRNANSRMLVNDADTAVIGGIYTRNKAVNYTKIPWLADIPIVGWFFKNKAEADTRSEVLIFLTPKIVNRASSIGG